MIIKFIKSGLNLDDGTHAHFVREVTSYEAYSVSIETDALKNGVELVGAVREYAYYSGLDLEDVWFCISEDAQLKADHGHLQKKLSKSFTVFELSDGVVVYTDLPVYVCNDAGKTIESYNRE